MTAQVTVLPLYDESHELAAFASILKEVDSEDLAIDADAWRRLSAVLETQGPILDTPRREAAQALLGARAAVLRDLCNAKRRTQRDLGHVPSKHKEFADRALAELVRRLLGERPAAPGSEEEGAVWQRVAQILPARIATEGGQPSRGGDCASAVLSAVKSKDSSFVREKKIEFPRVVA